MSQPPIPPTQRPEQPTDGIDPSTLPPPAWSGPPAPHAPAQPYGQQPVPQQQPYGQPPLPVPAWAKVAPKPSPLPSEPVQYQHLLRTPAFRWWRPIATLALFIAFSFVAINLLSVLLLVAGAASGENALAYLNQVLSSTEGGDLGPVAFLFTNLSLIVLIPMALLARRIVYRQPMKYLLSVRGGLRWRWQLRCIVITFPIYGLYIGVTTALTGTRDAPPPYFGALLVIVFFTTPLQCAAEEVAFRGLIMQTVGSWFRQPVVALVVSAVPAVALFAAAHGSPDPWILTQLGIFALSAVIVTWRTGGLEAAIALHCANNVILMFVNILYGGWTSTFIGGDTKGDPVSVLVDLGLAVVTVSLILWQAKKAGIDRHYRPPAQTSDVYGTVAPSPVAATQG